MDNTETQDTPVKLFKRAGWKPDGPAPPLVLEDSRLLEYRHPAELRMLALAIAAIVIMVALAVWLRDNKTLLAGAAVYLSMLLTSVQSVTYNRLQGAEVTPTQFPDIYQMLEELRQRFHAPPTHVFVQRKFSFKTEAMGLMAPYVIVLPSVLIDAIETEELRYVLGQALGHICFGHTRMTLLVGGEESALPSVLSWIASLRDVIFAGYWRAGIMTGDRAGILACGDVRKAIRTQVEISVGTNQSSEVQADDLIEQAFKVKQGITRLQAMLIRWRSPIPPLISRLEAMVAWAGLPD
jgi:Peptidase family M48